MITLALRKAFSLQFSSRYLVVYELISLLFNISIFIGMSVFVSKENSMNYAGFVLPGLGAMEMMTAALVAPKAFVDAEIHAGTLEYLILSCRSITALMAIENLILLSRSLVICLFYFLTARLLSQPSQAPISTICVVTGFLLWLQFWSFGLIAAGVAMATRRGNGLNTLLLIGACLVGGVYFPKESIPSSLQWVSSLNTLNFFTLSLRGALSWSELYPAVITTLATFIFGITIFYVLLNWARKEGSLFL